MSDTSTSRIVGTATAAVERKFIHSCGKVAHIEDVVVDSTYRGKKLGQRSVALWIWGSNAQWGQRSVALSVDMGVKRTALQ